MRVKRLLVISLCVLLALPACAKQEPNVRGTITSSEQNVRGTITSAETDAGNGESETSGETASNPEADPSTKESPTAEASSTSAEGETGSSVSLGHSADNLYVNDFIGIGCRLSDEWVFLSDEEIREVNDLSIQKIGNDYKEALDQLVAINDMIATNKNGRDSISITLEKLGISYYTITAEQYIEVGKDSAVYALKKMGMENIEQEVRKIPFLGGEAPALIIDATFQGTDVLEVMIPYECPGYMAVIAICTWQKTQEETLGLLDCFYKLD